jgi:hypothetical protein
MRPGLPAAAPSGATGIPLPVSPGTAPLTPNSPFNQLFGGLSVAVPLNQTSSPTATGGGAFPGAGTGAGTATVPGGMGTPPPGSAPQSNPPPAAPTPPPG